MKDRSHQRERASGEAHTQEDRGENRLASTEGGLGQNTHRSAAANKRHETAPRGGKAQAPARASRGKGRPRRKTGTEGSHHRRQTRTGQKENNRNLARGASGPARGATAGSVPRGQRQQQRDEPASGVPPAVNRDSDVRPPLVIPRNSSYNR